MEPLSILLLGAAAYFLLRGHKDTTASIAPPAATPTATNTATGFNPDTDLYGFDDQELPVESYEERMERTGVVPPGMFSDPENFLYRDIDIDKFISQAQTSGNMGTLQGFLSDPAMAKHITSAQLLRVKNALGASTNGELDALIAVYNQLAYLNPADAPVLYSRVAPIQGYDLTKYSSYGSTPMVAIYWNVGNPEPMETVETVARFKDILTKSINDIKAKRGIS